MSNRLHASPLPDKNMRGKNVAANHPDHVVHGWYISGGGVVEEVETTVVEDDDTAVFSIALSLHEHTGQLLVPLPPLRQIASAVHETPRLVDHDFQLLLGKSISGVHRLLPRVDANVLTTLLDGFYDTIASSLPRERSLTEPQRDWLIESGAMTAEEIEETEAEIAAGGLIQLEMRTYIQTVMESLSTEEVAQRLGIDKSRVRHRVAKGLLYSFQVDRRHRFPTWQFADTQGKRLLPGLKNIIEALPEDLDPASVAGLVTSPQDDLLIDGEPVSVRDWLLSGKPVDEAMDVVAGDDL